MTNAEYDNMRSAARETVEICLLGEALDPTLLADTPLSAVACFLAGCVSLSEIEYLEESMQGASRDETSSRSMAAQLETAKSDLDKLMETMTRHAKFWPVARELVDVLQTQMSRSNAVAVSPSTLASIASQVEAIHVLVRRPAPTAKAAATGEGDERKREAKMAPVQIRKINDLESLRATFPHLC